MSSDDLHTSLRRAALRREEDELIRREARKERKQEATRTIALKREMELLEQQIKLDQQTETIRNDFIKSIRELLRSDFLAADTHFYNAKSNLLSKNDYEKEKIAFVQSWVAGNIQRNKNAEEIIPDDEQANCIAAVHGQVQVVARAGSGKTATLVNRAFFLQKHCGVKPSEMMLLAFNRKAAEEMERRLTKLLEGQSPYVMTFHALAHAIVHPDQNLIHDSSDGRNQALSGFVQDVIDDRLRNPDFVSKIRKVMEAHFKEDWDKIESGGYHLEKEEMLQYRRALQRETLHGEFVKSFGEKLIANFLFENKVGYLYEPIEKCWMKNYHPDFMLKRGDGTGVVIEYFGMAGDPDYDQMSTSKREYWRTKPGWTLVELTPEDIKTNGSDGFLRNLQTTLENDGFVFRRMSEDEIWHQISRRAIDRFSSVTRSFIARCRKLEYTPKTLQLRISGYTAGWSVESDFLDIAAPIYADYLERLDVEDKEDFDGLMHRAAKAVEDGITSFSRHIKKQHGDLANLRFLLIDEYQDFSKLFHSMIEAIRRQNPDLQIFCVGDDWQAINGFAGSDLKYYNNFSTYFPASSKLHISTNYRSSAGIVEIGNMVMKGQGKPNAVKLSPRYIIESPCKHDIEWV